MKKKIGCIMLAVVFVTAFLVACKGEDEAALFPLEKDILAENEEPFDSEEEKTNGEDVAERIKSTELIVVHVCGAVKLPGVYELPTGSRSLDAVNAAGGFDADACEDYLNLAKLLEDGMRLEIPTYAKVKEAKAQGMIISDDGSMSAGAATADGLININKADLSQLCTLPGIGESRAESIIAYRQEHGDFQKKEDIMQVTGIKSGMYEKIESLITVGK